MNKWMEKEQEREGEGPWGEAEHDWEELPVCGISGLALATKSAVTAIGWIEEDGDLPRHLSDHLVQVQNIGFGWNHTCQGAQPQGEDVNLRGAQGAAGLAPLLCWAKPMPLDNKVTTNTMAIGNIMTIGNWLPWIFSCRDLLTPSFPWETLFFFNPFILVYSRCREKLPRSYKEISYTSPFSFLSSWYMYEN